MATRQPPKTPDVKKALRAQREADRRAREAAKVEQERVAQEQRAAREAAEAAEVAAHAARVAARAAEAEAAMVAAWEVDARALNPEATDDEVAAYVAAQRTPPVAEKTPYSGPMVALKSARAHYVKAANGILCNGDRLATVCGAHSREETVRALQKALKLEVNPYSHLNPGQQSMNMRNRARQALKVGTLTMADIEAAFKAE